MNNFEKSVFNAIGQYKMLSEHDKVLIALSGGKDSVALLIFLIKFKDKLNISLFGAHVNHMIRGSDAYSDQNFCKSLCEKYDIPFFTLTINVPKIAAEKSMSVEEAARNVRYEYFSKLCQEHGINKIATAHTASDNTETVIYNIIRGSGMQGICGIPPIRNNVIRPLIFCTKEETVEYCISNNTNFCVDSTNSDDAYDRNNIRLNIVPHMKKRNPSIDVSFSKLSYIASCNRMLVTYIADEFLKKHQECLPLEETARLFEDEKMLSCSHEILSKKCGITIPFDIFMQCRDVVVSRKTGKTVKIAHNVYLCTNYDKIEFKSELPIVPYYELILCLGKNIHPNEKVSITVLKEENAINYKNINNLTKKATFNFDKIYGDIFARKKKDGDSYICGGMTRSVKKFFSDSKISRESREFIPVICDRAGIIWVPGMKVCDRVIPEKNGNNITIIVEFVDEK